MTTAQRSLFAVLTLTTLTGSARPYYSVENNDTSPPLLWETEGRTKMRYAAIIPVGQAPVDLCFEAPPGRVPRAA
jgi:hypothetical protein